MKDERETTRERENVFLCLCVWPLYPLGGINMQRMEEIDSWKQSEELVILNTTRHHTHTHTLRDLCDQSSFYFVI